MAFTVFAVQVRVSNAGRCVDSVAPGGSKTRIFGSGMVWWFVVVAPGGLSRWGVATMDFVTVECGGADALSGCSA